MRTTSRCDVVALKAFGQASRIKKGYVYDVSLTIPRCESLALEIDSILK